MLPPALSLLPAHPLAFLDVFQLRRDAAPRRPLEPPQPDAVRAAYLRDLLPLVRRAQDLAMEELSPILEAAGGVRLDSAEGWREDKPSPKGKAKKAEPAPRGRTLARPLPEGKVREAMQRAAARFLKEHPAPVVKAKASRAAKATRKHTDIAVAAQFAAAARRKRQPLPMTPAVRKAVAAFTRENVALIKTIPRKHFAAIRRIVLEHGMAGARQTTIARELREQFGVTKRRAAIIARDQVGKLFGVLQQVRQQEAGVRSYVWRTVRDNRVRAKHEAREGKRYPWSRPPGGGHPGHEINCRCYPEPVLPRGSLPAPAPTLKPKPKAQAAPAPTPAEPKRTTQTTYRKSLRKLTDAQLRDEAHRASQAGFALTGRPRTDPAVAAHLKRVEAIRLENIQRTREHTLARKAAAPPPPPAAPLPAAAAPPTKRGGYLGRLRALTPEQLEAERGLLDAELAASRGLPTALERVNVAEAVEEKRRKLAAEAKRRTPAGLTAEATVAASRVPTPAPAAPKAPPLSSLSPQDFSGRVMEAALSVAREALEHTGPGDAPGMFGSDRVFIRHLWERLGDGISLEDFKARMLEANRARLLNLSRADLVEAMRQEDVQPSEIAAGPARFHFVAIPFKQIPRR